MCWRLNFEDVISKYQLDDSGLIQELNQDMDIDLQDINIEDLVPWDAEIESLYNNGELETLVDGQLSMDIDTINGSSSSEEAAQNPPDDSDLAEYLKEVCPLLMDNLEIQMDCDLDRYIEEICPLFMDIDDNLQIQMDYDPCPANYFALVMKMQSLPKVPEILPKIPLIWTFLHSSQMPA